MDEILALAAMIVPAAGAAGIVIKQAIFYTRVVRQAVQVFEDHEESNLKIYDDILADPKKKELARVLEGGVRRIKGLTNLEG